MQVKFYLFRKGGGGGKRGFIHTEGGGTQKVWAGKISDSQFSHFVTPTPVSIINKLHNKPVKLRPLILHRLGLGRRIKACTSCCFS